MRGVRDIFLGVFLAVVAFALLMTLVSVLLAATVWDANEEGPKIVTTMTVAPPVTAER